MANTRMGLVGPLGEYALIENKAAASAGAAGALLLLGAGGSWLLPWLLPLLAAWGWSYARH